MGDALISIIVPTYNRPNELFRSVKSLLDQTYKNIEVIIVDDCSIDNTRLIINSLKKLDERIRGFRPDVNLGTGAVYNFGIRLAKGDYIAIMDDDDIAHPERIEKQKKVFDLNPQVDVVFSTIEWIDESNKPFHISPGIVVREQFPSDYKEIFKLLYLGGGGIPNQTIMARREVWGSFQYPIEPRGSGDWILLMQLAAMKTKFFSISQPLVKVFKGQNKKSITSDSRKKVFPLYFQAYKIINHWLENSGITEFNKYRKTALSNLYLRECRHYLGIRGYLYIAKAFFAKPTNPNVYKEIIVHLQDGFKFLIKK